MNSEEWTVIPVFAGITSKSVMDNNTYQLDIREDTLTLRTTSFMTEKGSFLHSGIFNREFASSLAAGSVIIFAGFFFAVYYKIAIAHFIAAILLFAALFIIFRLFLFREPVLEALFDKKRGIITISRKRILGCRVRSYPVSELAGVGLNRKTFQPGNTDSIEFVEKIALQHGTVIPGFGQREDFYTVDLNFKEREKMTIFSSKKKTDAEMVAAGLKNFIEGECAEKN